MGTRKVKEKFTLKPEMLMRWLWLWPAGMAAFNVAFFIVTILGEGRVKVNVARYAMMYSAAIIPAMRGNMEPFTAAFTMPPV